jgi:hypothetical protein
MKRKEIHNTYSVDSFRRSRRSFLNNSGSSRVLDVEDKCRFIFSAEINPRTFESARVCLEEGIERSNDKPLECTGGKSGMFTELSNRADVNKEVEVLDAGLFGLRVVLKVCLLRGLSRPSLLLVRRRVRGACGPAGST